MSTATDEFHKLTEAGSILEELGRTGLEQFNGLIHEEFLNQLRGQLGIKAYQEMELNDPIVGAMLYALEMLMRPVTWTVEPFDESTEAATDAEFVEEVFADMSHSFASFIGEWMAAPIFGFAPFEIVWKKRNGYKRNPDESSIFTDGRTGISKLAIRHPSSVSRWIYDDDDLLIGMEQRPPPKFKLIELPAEKMLFYTVLQRKGNPEGTSLLRRSFIPYFRKKNIEQIEAIGIERELVGLPVFETPAEWWGDAATAENTALLEELRRIVRRLKNDEQAGIVMPKIMSDDGKTQLLTFELVSSGGRRAIDTEKAKEYYSRQIAMTILADVIVIGHESVGSFALASSKTNLFASGLGALLDDLEDTQNRDLIPRLMLLNGRDPAKSPKVRHGDVETPDIAVLGDYIDKLTGAGMHLFPTEDGEMERFALRAANLPEGPAEMAPDLFRERQEMRTAAAEALAQQGAATFSEDDDDDEGDE